MSPRLPLYCPPGGLACLAGLEPEADLRSVFDVHELPGRYRVGPFELSGVPLPHYVPNVGVRLENGLVALAYTGDTGPDPLLAELGRDTDLYIVEATDWKGEPQQSHRNLLTSEEAGYRAAQAGTRRLMLTHFWPGNDRAASAASARSTFGGEVLIAVEDIVVPLEPI
ncbi:MBL fold metallo-hydrolase [Micromonospora sediminicola]|uniref:MBL fold metallo-hydrolase n=1 Tax=Micromonospora sediminicola TaxID=946078 RepID=UPI00378B1EA9